MLKGLEKIKKGKNPKFNYYPKKDKKGILLNEFKKNIYEIK